MTPWRDPAVWQAVAAELRGYRGIGLGELLTEDAVRFAAARALVAAGVEASRLRNEWPHPDLKGCRVDLVVGGGMPDALIEFKFPREPNGLNAAWTMTLGEILKDLYRLAVYRGAADRLFALVESDLLSRYLASAGRRYGFDLAAGRVELEPARIATLPPTATAIIGPHLIGYPVTAHRTHTVVIDAALRLTLFTVDSAQIPRPPDLPAQRTGPNRPGTA